MAAVNSEAQITNHPCNNSNIRQLNNNDFFFTEFHTLPPPLKISHQLTNTSSEICIKLIV